MAIKGEWRCSHSLEWSSRVQRGRWSLILCAPCPKIHLQSAPALERPQTPQKTAERRPLTTALRERPEDGLSSMVVSYIGIRRAIGMSGLLLPVLLGPVGWLVFGIEIQDNMSSYYHTTLRDVFVGTLCAIGIFLFCYKGHDWIENWTANFGCAAALGVALFPLDENSDPLYQRSVVGYVHTLSGGVFFLTLAFYSLFHFPSSKSGNDEREPHEKQRDFFYRSSGVVILLSLFAMGSYLFFLPHQWRVVSDRHNVLFWLEWIALWAFAAAWLTKGRVIIADVAIDLMAVTQQHLVSHLTDGERKKPSGDSTDSKVSKERSTGAVEGPNGAHGPNDPKQTG